MNVISGGGSFTRKNITDLNANFDQLFAGLVGTPGNIIYCNPASSYLGTQDGSIAAPYTSLLTAYGAGRTGYNDVIVLVGDGGTGATARLSSAFTWAKNALHLVGIASGVNISNRARIAPTSGATAFAAFFTVSGSGCLFRNVQFYQGFDTGTTSQIAVTVTGGRNLFDNCHIAGMGDAASAQSAGSRSLKISGTGENMFVNCTIGIDTVTRTAANASVEFASATPRNQFVNCTFPFMTSASTPLGIIGSGTGNMDRFQYFDNCVFINAVQSTSTTISGLATLAASSGGLIVMKDCTLVGITEYGTDATSRGQVYIDGGTVTAATTGIAVNPT